MNTIPCIPESAPVSVFRDQRLQGSCLKKAGLLGSKTEKLGL